MLVIMGGVLFQPIIGHLLENHWAGKLHLGAHIFTTVEFQRALIVLPIALISSSLLVLFLDETHPNA